MSIPKRYVSFILYFALSMMVGSSLISYFLVRQNDAKISSFRMEVQSKEALIRDIWNNIGRKEAKADTMILLSNLSNINNADLIKLKKYYLSDYPELKESFNPADILTVIEQEKKSDIDHINNLYLEQADIQNMVYEKERSNKLYADIAFFLQILSLVLIIIRNDV